MSPTAVPDYDPDVMDFSKIEGLKPIDPQRVAFEIESATAGMSKKNFPKVDVRLRITAPESVENRVLFDTVSMAPKALPFTKEKLVALGIGDFRGSVTALAEALVGLDGVALVGIDQNDNEDPNTGEKYDPRNTIKKYYPSGTPLSTSRVAELD